LISSTITLGIKEPLAKIELFLAFHRDQRVACHIIKKPLRIFSFLADPLNTSKSEDNDARITITTPSHLNISHHTIIALGQCKKRWMGN
jgi:hypothetical protein